MTMADAQYHTIANADYENIFETAPTNNLDAEFTNYMVVLIAEYIGIIPTNYQSEHERLTAYAYYPPMNDKQLRGVAIDNITSSEVKQHIADKVFTQLEMTFENKVVQWNSIVQTTAKRFVSNAVEEAVDDLRKKLLENINEENQTTSVIVQRFVLLNNQLKLV